MTGTAETRRQLIHIAVGGFAFLLRDLTWWEAATAAGVATVVNATLLPRVLPSLFRAGEAPLRSGIVIYPLAVLGLILVFRHQLEIAAVAWGILAAGDGAATLVGAHTRTPALPWNPDKSVGGLAAFLAIGGLAGIALAHWMRAPGVDHWWLLIVAPVLAAVVAGFIETAPIKLDDNISVSAAAALVMWSLGLVEVSMLSGAATVVLARLPLAVTVNLIVATVGWRAGTVTGAGAATGFAIGLAIAVGAGWPGWALLVACFLAATLTTRVGFDRKARAGIAESRGGRRGPANAIANTGIAAWAALLSIGMAQPELAWLAMAAALITGASDTVASEIGKAWGRTTRLVIGFTRTEPGTSGAVSTEGTLAGIASAATLAALAAVLGVIPWVAVGVVVVAATVAALIEGALGAALEASGVLDNDALNFVNSLTGAALALVFWRVV